MMLIALCVVAAASDAPEPSFVDRVSMEDSLLPTHFHGEISVLAAAGISTVPTFGGGAGLHLEVGAVLEQSHVFSARLSAATSGVFYSFQVGFSFAERFADRFSLGLGITWGGAFGLGERGGFLGFQLPIRLTVRFGPFKRYGMMAGFELAPGAAHNAGTGILRPPLPLPTIMGQLTIGYAVW